MLPIPYLKEVLIGAVVLLVVFIGVQTARLSICKSNLRASQAELQNVVNMLELSRSTVVDLRAKIDTQNIFLREAQALGMSAQAAQDASLRIARELALAKQKLDSLLQEHSALKKRAENLNTCETYELVLQSIAGVLP
ncbi:MAG TPA: hypothetical protein VMW79_07895 [Anaerolineae bacterium]|nr:hypothetical protein [Anaerolineae bacterium]